jgi:putative membrane protein
MGRFIIRWAITAIALFVAAWLVPGIVVESSGYGIYVVMALVLAVVNALVRPILTLLSCPLILLTFGLFTFVVNAAAFWIASGVAQRLGVGFRVEGFLAALFGSIVVSLVSTALTVLLPDE